MGWPAYLEIKDRRRENPRPNQKPIMSLIKDELERMTREFDDSEYFLSQFQPSEALARDIERLIPNIDVDFSNEDHGEGPKQ